MGEKRKGESLEGKNGEEKSLEGKKNGVKKGKRVTWGKTEVEKGRRVF